MVIIVQRILCDHLGFEDIKGKVVQHIPHLHSQALRERSTVVSCFVKIWKQK